MSAWLLAALLCTPVSAQVFETGGAAAPVAPVTGAVGASMGAGASVSPISAVPGAALLAPSLNSAVLSAFPGQAATNLPAGAVRLAAPIPALPAAAAVSAAPAASGVRSSDSSPRTSAAPSRRELVPPSSAAGAAGIRAVAADRSRSAVSDADASPERSSARLDASARGLAAPLVEAGDLDLLSAEGAASAGRKIFDRVEDRASLADGSAGGAPGEFISDAPSPSRDPLLTASNGATLEVESLHDAVASPVPAAAAPGAVLSFFRLPGSLFAPSRGSGSAAPSAAAAAAVPAGTAPITFERLSLELGSGLVVKVRAALGFAPSGAAAATGASANGKPAAPRAAPRSRAPITSTEWLERRGLLESLSASEAAASQEAAALPAAAISTARSFASGRAPASSPRAAAARSFVLDPAAPSRVPPFAWWALAFLPAGLVLLKELL